MVWSLNQRLRLAIEKEKLEKYFRLGITWIDPQDETKVEVLVKSNSNKEYTLRIYIPRDFPNSCPALVVVSPLKLQLRNGSRLPEANDSFHTLVDTDGFHRICHFYPPDWTQDITLFQVFMKGRLWIEGYEAHLRTGMKMNEYLGEHKFASQSGLNDQQEISSAPSAGEQQRGGSLLVRPTHNQTRSNPFDRLISRSSRARYYHERTYEEPTEIDGQRDVIEDTDHYNPVFHSLTTPVQRVLPQQGPPLLPRRTLSYTSGQNMPLDTNDNETLPASEAIDTRRYRRHGRISRRLSQGKPKPDS